MITEHATRSQWPGSENSVYCITELWSFRVFLAFLRPFGPAPWGPSAHDTRSGDAHVTCIPRRDREALTSCSYKLLVPCVTTREARDMGRAKVGALGRTDHGIGQKERWKPNEKR